jgi:hypothetical protein
VKSIFPALLASVILVSCTKEKGDVLIRVKNETGHDLTMVVVYSSAENSDALGGKAVLYGHIGLGSQTSYRAHERVPSLPVVEFEMEGYGLQHIWIPCPVGMSYLEDGSYSLIVSFENNYLSGHFQHD